MLTVMRLTGGAFSVSLVSAARSLIVADLAIADQKILLLGVGDAPQNRVRIFALRIRRVADVERLDLLRAIVINPVHRPRQLEVRARQQNAAGHRLAEPFQHRLLRPRQ